MLFKTIDEVKLYITMNAVTDIKVITPHIKRAEQKYIKHYLGKELYEKLHTYINADIHTDDDKLEALEPYVLTPLAFFTYADAIPQLNVISTNTGFGVVQTATVAPASKQRVDDLQLSQQEAGWDGIEALLEFLEENKADYSDWVNSDAYTLAHRNLINSAVDFNDKVNINLSRLAFTKLRPTMDNVENLIIANVISKELLDEIKEQLQDDDLSDENATILDNLQRALANLALSEQKSVPDKDATNIYAAFNVGDDIREQYRRVGQTYLSKAADVIKTTPDDYPTYKASALYTSDTDNLPFENAEDSGVFVMGIPQ